jgi:hypothetical protein
VASRLDALQTDLLRSFFSREKGFFLTGGAALAGFHLGHRTTADLDLFTESTDLELGESALRAAAAELGAQIESLRTSPEFRRRLVRRGRETVVVDLVLDRTAAGDLPRVDVGGIRLDAPLQILANKLCTLLSRAEVRDLVDVILLERAGYSVEEALPLARRKDGGLTPAQLAWVLGEIRIGDDARVPAGLSPAEVREFVQQLGTRLARLAWPS